MREIKFRAWCTLGDGYYLTNFMDNFNLTVLQSDCYVIEQYTGLKDKNGVEIYEGDIMMTSTGKTYPDSDLFKVMFFEEERCAFGITSVKNNYNRETKKGLFCGYKPFNGMLDSLNREGIYVDSCGEILEVIGNIHQNPELLGGNNEA